MRKLNEVKSIVDNVLRQTAVFLAENDSLLPVLIILQEGQKTRTETLLCWDKTDDKFAEATEGLFATDPEAVAIHVSVGFITDEENQDAPDRIDAIFLRYRDAHHRFVLVQEYKRKEDGTITFGQQWFLKDGVHPRIVVSVTDVADGFDAEGEAAEFMNEHDIKQVVDLLSS